MFFREKTLMISPTLLRSLRVGSCKNISASDRLNIFLQARHVVAYLDDRNPAAFNNIPTYNSFPHLKVLSTLPKHSPSDKILVELEIGKPMITLPRPEPGQDGPGLVYCGINHRPQRHPASEEFLILLLGIGLQVDRLEIDLVYDPATYSCNHIYWLWLPGVYEHLESLGQERMKGRLANHQRQAATLAYQREQEHVGRRLRRSQHETFSDVFSQDIFSTDFLSDGEKYN